ncbi:hypothetical protein Ae201684P_021585 [Aphanomyces euteiches]|nr:hypothetical protein Ae201684P_021585 [Aphanomyces euteiches]
MRDQVMAGDCPEMPYTDRPPRAPPEALLTQSGIRRLTQTEADTRPGDVDTRKDFTGRDGHEAVLVDDNTKQESNFSYFVTEHHQGLPPPSIFTLQAPPPDLDQRTLPLEVVIREGVDLTSEEMESQLALIPEIPPQVPFDMDQLDYGEVGQSEEERQQMREVLDKYKANFIRSGNGLPPPARGTVCDIDVGSAKPIAHRPRRVRPEHLQKLFELLRGLLSYGLITFSNSQWASPIVIVLKKGGSDIRLCIDYRGINDLQELMRSPMPTLDAMLSGFHAVQWLLSLDNASGFWVVRVTKRARLISAFICPLGHFEWTRMGQCLNNAPMIYQRMITNALYGFVDLPPGMNEVDEVGEPRDMFQIGHVRDASSMPAPANRTSFVDDISDGADSWTGVVDLTDRILQRLTYFNISISALKSKFGKTVVDFLGHLISREGIHAKPRGLHQILQMPFPKSLRAMQSFLGSINFYSRFIEVWCLQRAQT